MSGVSAQFGLPQSGKEIRARIRASLPWRPWRLRTLRWSMIENYGRPIPDAALARYADALETMSFVKFSIGWPVYGWASRQDAFLPTTRDPWLVGWIAAEGRTMATMVNNNDLGIVLAYWDDEELHPTR